MKTHAPQSQDQFDNIDFDPIDFDAIDEAEDTLSEQLKQDFVLVVEDNQVISVKQRKVLPPVTSSAATKLGAYSLGIFFDDDQQNSTRKLDSSILDKLNNGDD